MQQAYSMWLYLALICIVQTSTQEQLCEKAVASKLHMISLRLACSGTQIPKKIDTHSNITQTVVASLATLQHHSGCVAVLTLAGGWV